MKVVYPNAIGIHDEDVIEVRIGTGKKTKDHILAVRHRIVGWISPWEWGLVHHFTSLIVHLEADVPTTIAWLGLTYANYAIIRASIDAGTPIADAIQAFLGNKQAQARTEDKAVWTTIGGLAGYAAVSGSLTGLLGIVVGTISGPTAPTQKEKDKIMAVADSFSTTIVSFLIAMVAAAIELKVLASLPAIIGAII